MLRLQKAQRIARENQGQPSFRQQSIRRLFDGSEPRLVQAREQLFQALTQLGVP